MKVIVADKISERGVELLKKTPGLKVVVTTKDTIGDELADAVALIVRSATRVTPDLLAKAPHLRAVGREPRLIGLLLTVGPQDGRMVPMIW